MEVPTFTYDWQHIREAYNAYTLGERAAKGHTLRRLLGRWEVNAEGNYGGTSAQMRAWMRDGFHVPPLAGGAVPVSHTQMPDWTYNDTDGEYDHDLFVSGEPEYYLDSSPVVTPRGVRLELGYGFLYSVPAEVITQYGAWIGSMINGLSARGMDLEVSIEYEGSRRYSNRGKLAGTTRHRIVVSRFGERAAGTNWSALFSPACYRHVAFLAYCLVEEENLYPGTQAVADSGLGYSASQHWGISYDPATRTIRTQANRKAYDFPAERMTDDFLSLNIGE